VIYDIGVSVYEELRNLGRRAEIWGFWKWGVDYLCGWS